MQINRIKSLIHKEFLLDWKEKNSLASILIYVTSTVFVCYLSFQTIIETTTFNALLWIIILFTSVNTITKSFVQESENRLLYMYSLANPQEIIVGKLIYNSILLLLISLVTFSAYALFLGNPIVNLPGFLGALVLGSLGLSILLTLMAAIASKSIKEVAYHYRYSAEWVIRLGDGTDESFEKMQSAIDDIWPYSNEMFVMDDIDKQMIEEGIGVDLDMIKVLWNERVNHIFSEALLSRPDDQWMQKGGKQGKHSEQMGYILAELQWMQRAYPGLKW